MPETTYPTGPVKATVERWGRLARVFAAPCVVGIPTTNAYGATISGLNLTIGRGTDGISEAWVRAFFHVHDTADRVFAVPPNGHATQSRIDRVVIRWDPATEVALLTHVQGTPAASPVAPDLVQENRGKWDLPLWRFTVPPNNGGPLHTLIDDRMFFDPDRGGNGITAVRNDPLQRNGSGSILLDPSLTINVPAQTWYAIRGQLHMSNNNFNYAPGLGILGTAVQLDPHSRIIWRSASAAWGLGRSPTNAPTSPGNQTPGDYTLATTYYIDGVVRFTQGGTFGVAWRGDSGQPSILFTMHPGSFLRLDPVF